MPRARKAGSGGARTGTPGVAYANRTDLNGGPLAVAAAPNQPYGQAGAQRAAQSAVPMGSPSVPSPAPPPAASGPPPAPPPVTPGSLGPLMGPTQRPTEPLTAGLPSGPGPGPRVGPATAGNLSDIIRQAGQTAGSVALLRLADTAQVLGQ